MRLNNQDEDDEDYSVLDYKSYNEAIDENKEKILNRPINEVNAFLENMFNSFLDMADEVEDQQLSNDLKAYITIGVGTFTESILKLRKDNEILWNENNLGKHYQTPDLN
tara:strand:+ start:283 stop:609 length:327 start_codon:yes stop_codon:yes gene_type:complete